MPYYIPLTGNRRGRVFNMEFIETNNQSATVSWRTSTALLLEIQSGSENAWHDFYIRYAAMINHVGEKRNLTPEECDDLMIDVMVIFWKKVDSFLADPHRGRFRTYLTRIAEQVANKLFHKNRQLPPPVDSEEDYPDDIDQYYMEEWRNFILRRALEDLKESVDTDTYNVFYMSVVQKRPVEDIARVTRKTPNNIYVIRSRCIKKLKQLIAHYRQCEEAELIRHSHKNIQPR